MTEQAKRHNKGKPKLSLVMEMPNALIGAARVMEGGIREYGRRNWQKGLPWTEVMDSLDRHMLAFLNGEDIDQKSGKPHVDHMLCNVLFLAEFYRTRKEFDDRGTVSDIKEDTELDDWEYRLNWGYIPAHYIDQIGREGKVGDRLVVKQGSKTAHMQIVADGAEVYCPVDTITGEAVTVAVKSVMEGLNMLTAFFEGKATGDNCHVSVWRNITPVVFEDMAVGQELDIIIECNKVFKIEKTDKQLYKIKSVPDDTFNNYIGMQYSSVDLIETIGTETNYAQPTGFPAGQS